MAINVYGIAGLAVALRVLDQRADDNASIGDLDREYGTWKYFPKIIRDRRVVERALESMPENATYRVVIGSRWKPTVRTRWSSSIERDFLRFYLLPRRQSDSGMPPWVFCLACNPSALGGQVQVLSRGSDGMLFLRIIQ